VEPEVDDVDDAEEEKILKKKKSKSNDFAIEFDDGQVLKF
jgi:hypothetical protein